MTAEPASAEPAAPDLEQSPTPPPPPPLGERLVAVLVTPWEAFGQLHGGWGWAAPWVIVSCLGILAGIANVANGQFTVVVERQMQRQMAAKQAELEAQGIELPEEALDFQRKLGIFSVKIGSVVGPPLTGLWGLLIFATLAFVAILVCGDPRRTELMRSVSLVAWCGLAQGVGYVAQTLASIGGSPAPTTNLSYLVDAVERPLAAAALGRLDPVTLYFYGLFALGLHRAGGVPLRVSALFAGGCYLGLSLLQLGLGALQGG